MKYMKDIPDNSIDSIVTDPPYELGFMGKTWDKSGITYNIDMWKECLRVLKPGGHLLAFGGTRTYHRMACAIEDAGFEIRDQIQWIYGSGFPKSLNIGKAVDKLRGNEREFLGTKKKLHISTNNTNDGWKRPSHYNKDGTTKNEMILTKGTSEWEGWGTALKPANEPICLARKPLSEKTIAENVLKWGTGGLNIDGCRVEVDIQQEEKKNSCRNGKSYKGKSAIFGQANSRTKFNAYSQGRFPANVIHDGSDEVVREFPNTKSGNINSSMVVKSKSHFNPNKEGWTLQNRNGDSGSASRFFYCAKASKAERDAGCEGMKNKIGGGMKGTEDKTLLTGSGNIRNNIMRNNHPTVKPIALMRYLCRLTTPPKGIVLDPFMGSGSTGIGAKLEGFSFIGIELEKEYFEIAKKRIEIYNMQQKLDLYT